MLLSPWPLKIKAGARVVACSHVAAAQQVRSENVKRSTRHINVLPLFSGSACLKHQGPAYTVTLFVLLRNTPQERGVNQFSEGNSGLSVLMLASIVGDNRRIQRHMPSKEIVRFR